MHSNKSCLNLQYVRRENRGRKLQPKIKLSDFFCLKWWLRWNKQKEMIFLIINDFIISNILKLNLIIKKKQKLNFICFINKKTVNWLINFCIRRFFHFILSFNIWWKNKIYCSEFKHIKETKFSDFWRFLDETFQFCLLVLILFETLFEFKVLQICVPNWRLGGSSFIEDPINIA